METGPRGGCTLFFLPLLMFMLLVMIWPAFAQERLWRGPVEGQQQQQLRPQPQVQPQPQWGGWHRPGPPFHHGYGYNPYRHYGPPVYAPPIPIGAGRFFHGQWYPQVAGSPCWAFVPILGWQWTCGG